MLTERIAEAFGSTAARLQELPGTRVVAAAQGSPGTAKGQEGNGATGWPAIPLVLETDRSGLEIQGSPAAEECFGPVIVAVRYRDGGDLLGLLDHLEPALTATLHAAPGDDRFARPVLQRFSQKAGRLVWNGYPTGVAVTWAMHHGGPYPATTGPLHTSVGAAAIRRWLRPVSFQDVPEELLPLELRDEPGPEGLVPRRVDGQLVLPGAR